MEGEVLGLKAVGAVRGGAGDADGGIDVEHERAVGAQATGGRAVELGDAREIDAARVALVGGRGVVEAVAQDDLAGRERRSDDLVDELGSARLVEQDLRRDAQLRVVGVEQDAAHRLADDGTARLAQHAHGQSGGLELLGEEPDLRRLAGALTALEGDEGARA